MDARERSAALAEFAKFRKEHLRGDERSEAQTFLTHLFQALGHPGVFEVGAKFEHPVKTASGAHRRLDLFWPDRVIVEMKSSGVRLDDPKVYRQTYEYWERAVPGRPRYVVTCNFDELYVYDFDLQLDTPITTVAVDQLPDNVDALAFLLPEPTEPTVVRDTVADTREAARKAIRVFHQLVERGEDWDAAQRFLLQCVVAMVAEATEILPRQLFTRTLHDASNGAEAYDTVAGLFRAMNEHGITRAGRYKGTPYFNGGLFARIEGIELADDELESLRGVASADWSQVRPEVFGTLFEGSLDEDERHTLGAHFTSEVDILKVVRPTIVTPWAKRIEAADGDRRELAEILAGIRAFRVLDPACGSGNFLYVSYRELRHLEHDVMELLGMSGPTGTTLANFYGIELHERAAMVARVTMMVAGARTALELGTDPRDSIPFPNFDDRIVSGDALFTDWPQVDAIVGNPPFLGGSKISVELGKDYSARLRKAYPYVDGRSDLVSYWFSKSNGHLPNGGRAGLVSTSAVQSGHTRAASLDLIASRGAQIDHEASVTRAAWSGQANVHVSITNWTVGIGSAKAVRPKRIRSVVRRKSVLKGQEPGITSTFVISAQQRREILRADPAAKHYVHRFMGGHQLLNGGAVRYVIDLPHSDMLDAQREVPALMERLRGTALSARLESGRNLTRWWQLDSRRQSVVDGIRDLRWYVIASRHSNADRMPVFARCLASTRPADSTNAFLFDDYYSLGVLQSSTHIEWFRDNCSHLKSDIRYTSTSVFDTFPWPQNPTAEQVEAVEAAMRELSDYREGLTSGPDAMTLAQLYDTLRTPGRSRLRDLHEQLDADVLSAYGFRRDADLLAELLQLNLAIADDLAARGPGRPDLR